MKQPASRNHSRLPIGLESCITYTYALKFVFSTVRAKTFLSKKFNINITIQKGSDVGTQLNVSECIHSSEKVKC